MLHMSFGWVLDNNACKKGLNRIRIRLIALISIQFQFVFLFRQKKRAHRKTL